MNRKRIIFVGIIVFLSVVLRGWSQPSREKLLTKNFKFSDGIFATYKDWQHNHPTVSWDSVETNLAVNPTTFLAQVEYIVHKKTKLPVSIDSIWGIVIDGIPYVRLSKNEISKSTTSFAGLILRGRLCYFQYETTVEEKVPMTVYIPETGEPYATKKVSKKENIVREKLMVFETGEIADMNLPNFKKLIADDKELLNSVSELNTKEVRDKLFKCLLIYNDRNPAFLK